MVIGIMLFLFILILAVIVWLLYWLPNRIPNARTGKLVSRILGLVVLACLFSVLFEDQLFTKGDARSLVQEQQLILVDGFELLHNESTTFSPGDYYHTFTLKISP